MNIVKLAPSVGHELAKIQLKLVETKKVQALQICRTCQKYQTSLKSIKKNLKKNAKLFQNIAKTLQKMQKVAKRSKQVVKVVKSSQQITKVAKSCQMLFKVDLN